MNDTKMDLFLAQKFAAFSCIKCNGSALSAKASFTEIDKEYTKFKIIHEECRWEPS